MTPENETPEAKAERWMLVIKKYLDYAKTPGHDPGFLAESRKKIPFLDWVLDNPDLPPAVFFMAEPPPAKPPVVPWEQESPGMLHGGTVGKETEMILAAIAELKALVLELRKG